MIFFLILAAIACAVLYSPGIAAPLYLDDFIVLSNAEGIINTRFFGYASFWLSHQLAELMGLVLPFDVTIYYRIPNIAIHVLASTALFWLARELTGRRLVAGIAGALFLVHPIQTQAVTYITQRFEAQAALFMFIAAASYVRFRHHKSKYYLLLTVVAALLAASTKETAIALPLWIAFIEVIFFSGVPTLRQMAYWLPVAGAIAYPAWLAFKSTGGALVWIPIEYYLLSQGAVLTKYLQLVFLPGKQYLLYDFQPVTAVTATVLAQWVLVLVLFATGIYLTRRKPTVAFGIFTFFILLLPTSLVPLPDLIFEHRLYPAMAGVAIALATLFQPTRRTVALFTAVFLFLGYRTMVRNVEWTDRVRFYELHREAFPEEPRLLASLGTAYAQKGEVKKAIEANQAARKHLDKLNAYYYRAGVQVIDMNLATLYGQIGDMPKMMEEAQRALTADQNMPAAWMMIGSAKFSEEDFRGALVAYERAWKINPMDLTFAQAVREASFRLGELDRVREIDVRISSLQKQLQKQDEEKKPEPLRRAWQPTYVLFGTICVVLLTGVAFIRVGLKSFREVWLWLRTGSTVSVDKAAADLPDS
jgi:tetratricopeptide (TPR) repeat protein